MKILGISAHYHDSAAALVIDGVPVAAVQEERLSRRKNDASFPLGAIEWCLGSAGLEPADLDAVVFYERSMVFGDVAVLRSPEEGRFGTSIYVKRDGRWQVLQLQGTPTPLSRQSATVAADLLRSYAGRYRQENGLFVTIAVEGDGLTLQVDGRQKLPLTSDSATQFTIPGGFGTITFTATQDGRVTYQIKRGDGSLIKGERVS